MPESIQDFALDYKKEISYEFGITATDKLEERLSINGEVLYSERNVSYSYTDPDIHYQQFKHTFIALPIFGSYNVYKPLNIDFGGEVSRIVKSNMPNYKVFFENLNFINMLVGVRYNFLNHFNIHARYLHPITKISTMNWFDINGTSLGQSKLRSRTLSLAVGYSF
jgi:hypothetical protein